MSRDEDEWDETESADEEETETADCPSCGKAVYEQAEQCPYCGEYITQASPSGRRGVWVVVVAVVLILIVLSWGLGR